MTDHEKVQQLLRAKAETPVTFHPRTSALVVVDVSVTSAGRTIRSRRSLRNWCPA